MGNKSSQENFDNPLYLSERQDPFDFAIDLERGSKRSTFEPSYNEGLMTLARNTPSWTKFPPQYQPYVSFIGGGECAGKTTILNGFFMNPFQQVGFLKHQNVNQDSSQLPPLTSTYPEKLLNKLQYGVFAIVISIMSRLVGEKMFDLKALETFEHHVEDPNLLPIFHQYIPPTHLKACSEISTWMKEVDMDYCLKKGPSRNSNSLNFKFKHKLNQHHWDYLQFLWNLTEFQNCWQNRYAHVSSITLFYDNLNYIMDNLTLISSPNPTTISIDLLNRLSWPATRTSELVSYELRSNPVYSSTGLIDVCNALITEVHEKSQQYLDKILETDEQWQYKLTKDGNYICKVSCIYMATRGKHLDWYRGPLSHIRLSEYQDEGNEMIDKLTSKDEFEFEKDLNGKCIYSNNELERFYKDYLLWARTQGEVMNIKGGYNKLQFDNDNHGLELDGLRRVELNEEKLKGLIESDFGYFLWSLNFLHAPGFRDTVIDPHVLFRWLQARPKYNLKYKKYCNEDYIDNSSPICSENDQSEKSIKKFIDIFIQAYLFYQPVLDYTVPPKPEHFLMNNPLIQNGINHPKHVVMSLGEHYDGHTAAWKLMEEETVHQLFWVVPLSGFDQSCYQETLGNNNVLGKSLHLLYETLKLDGMKENKKLTQRAHGKWEFDLNRAHFLMAESKSFRNNAPKFMNPKIQKDYIPADEKEEFHTRLMLDWFQYFNDNGTINHDLNPYLNPYLEEKAQNGTKVVLVFTHPDVLYEKIKQGDGKFEFGGISTACRNAKVKPFKGDQNDPLQIQAYIIDQFVQVCNRSKVYNHKSPNVIVVNALDRDTVLDKLTPYFG
jgi:hypothetical protein